MNLREETFALFDAPRLQKKRRRTSYYERLENAHGLNGYEAVVPDALEAGASVLDVGCGDGSLLPYLRAKSMDLAYTGVDVSEKALAQARAEFGSADVCFVQGDVHAMPFRSDQFDVACSHMVMALVTDPLAAAKEIARVLRPGGTLRIFTPAYWRLGETARSTAFRDVSDTLTRLAPSVRDRGVGNDAFRERSSIENVLGEAFGQNAELRFEPSDFEIDLEPEDALQIFSLGMYQFFLVPDDEKGRVLHLLFDKLRSFEGPDSLVHLTRPMEVITVRKSRD